MLVLGRRERAAPASLVAGPLQRDSPSQGARLANSSRSAQPRDPLLSSRATTSAPPQFLASQIASTSFEKIATRLRSGPTSRDRTPCTRLRPCTRPARRPCGRMTCQHRRWQTALIWPRHYVGELGGIEDLLALSGSAVRRQLCPRRKIAVCRMITRRLIRQPTHRPHPSERQII